MNSDMPYKAEQNGKRGRLARWPFQIPPRGWRDIFLRVYRNVQRNNTGLIAAGIAFYFFLALFPALAVMISVFGLVADPVVITDQIASLFSFLPSQVVQIVMDQTEKIAGGSGRVLGIGLLVSLLLTLFAASKGVKAVIKALNIAYKEHETRHLIRQNLLAMGLTFFVVMAAIVALSAVAVLPAVIRLLDAEEVSGLLLMARWPLLFFAGLIILETIYRYAPSRAEAKWRWLSLGSVSAALLWLGVSALFSWYVSNFGKYNETYGALGAVAIMLMWLWLTAMALLLGAEINAAIEHQTSRDSTTGPEKPMGERGAYVADTIGDIP